MRPHGPKDFADRSPNLATFSFQTDRFVPTKARAFDRLGMTMTSSARLEASKSSLFACLRLRKLPIGYGSCLQSRSMVVGFLQRSQLTSTFRPDTGLEAWALANLSELAVTETSLRPAWVDVDEGPPGRQLQAREPCMQPPPSISPQLFELLLTQRRRWVARSYLKRNGITCVQGRPAMVAAECTYISWCIINWR